MRGAERHWILPPFTPLRLANLSAIVHNPRHGVAVQGTIPVEPHRLPPVEPECKDLSVQRPTEGVLLVRGLRLRCPRCGKGKMFQGWFRMCERCSACNFRFEREPGFFLGSIYINYGLTALLTTVAYVLLRFVWNYQDANLIWWFAGFCTLFPAFFFPFARALWLAMDCYFDSTSLEEDR